MVSIANAAAAYAKIGTQGGGGLQPRSTSGEDSFGDLVKNALGSTRDILKESEKQSITAAAGKADLTQVVTAVTNADVALQTVVAVRDKVISAYQAVISMPL